MTVLLEKYKYPKKKIKLLQQEFEFEERLWHVCKVCRMVLMIKMMMIIRVDQLHLANVEICMC